VYDCKIEPVSLSQVKYLAMALYTFCHGYFRPVLKIANIGCQLRRVWTYRTFRLPLDGFSWIWLFENFSKYVQKTQV